VGVSLGQKTADHCLNLYPFTFRAAKNQFISLAFPGGAIFAMFSLLFPSND